MPILFFSSHGVYVVIDDARLEVGVRYQVLPDSSQTLARLGEGSVVFYFHHYLSDEERLYLPHGRKVGSDDSVAEHLAQCDGEGSGEQLCLSFVAMFDVRVDEVAIGRVVEELALFELFVRHQLVVVMYHVVDDGLLHIARLYDDESLLVFSSRTSRHLFHQLESSFVGAEVGVVEHEVRIEDTHHAHSVEVESFRYNLCADEYVDITPFEVRQDAFVRRAVAGGV